MENFQNQELELTDAQLAMVNGAYGGTDNSNNQVNQQQAGNAVAGNGWVKDTDQTNIQKSNQNQVGYWKYSGYGW